MPADAFRRDLGPDRLRLDSGFLDAVAERVVVADGAMGTMLQAPASRRPVLDDFAGLEGCNEILNDTRPDVVAGIHRAYFAAGADAVETNTFGANLPNLADYDIADRIRELAEKGARIAREVADECATADRPRFVLGSVGPGTKLPTLGHESYARLRDAYTECGRGLIAGGSDALVVETCQDLLQVKAAVLGLRRAMRAEGRRVPIITHVTVETTGTMLLGSEIGAALTAIEPLGVDLIGLNCATGPGGDERAPAHAGQARADPAVGDAERRPAGSWARAARSTRSPRTSWPRRSPGSSATTGCGWSAAAAGRPRRTSAPSPTRSPSVTPARRAPAPGARASARSTPRCRSARTPRCSWSASGPTPTAPRRSARPCSRSAGTTASRSPATRPATART